MPYRKSILILSIIIITAIAFLLWEASKDEDQDSQPSLVLPTETFIRTHMMNENGTLRTHLKDSTQTSENYARGSETLSESLGIWMRYLVLKKDLKSFQSSYNNLIHHFISEKGVIDWKLKGNGENVASTNALVDDLRIILALYEGGEVFQNHTYLEKADELTQSLKKQQLNQNVFVNFYDSEYDTSSNKLALSYIHVKALHRMNKRQQISEEVWDKHRTLLIDAPVQRVFYPFSVSLSQEWHFKEEAHLVNQLYISLYRAQLQLEKYPLYEFLKEEFQQKGYVPGRYKIATQQPTVDYESPAVYGLLILTALEHSDEDFANNIFQRMKTMQIREKSHEYYGGYIDLTTQNAHIFDNLIALYAERRMYDEGLLDDSY